MTETVGTGEGRLKRSTIFFYGIAELPLYMMLLPLSVIIPNFYSRDLGIELALIANVILAARLFDVFTDPIIGRLSDMTRSRWGRRRPWIIASVPIVMIGIYKLFLPEPPVSAWYMLTWMVVFWTGWTMFLIPYFAWAAELTPDYQERSVVTGFRSMMGNAGQLLAQLLPVTALAFFGFGGAGNVLFLIAVLSLVLIPLVVIPAVTQVPERRDYVPSATPLSSAVKLMWANGPFKRLVIAFLLNFTGLAVITVLYLFFIRGVLHEEDRWVYILATFYACNMLGVPLWVWLSRKIGKHRSWAASLILIASAGPFYLLLGEGDIWYMLPVTVISGIAAGSFQALPNSMKADVIDLDSLLSGEDRAALFFSVWSLVQKGALSIGSYIALSLVAFFGFDPAPDALNSGQSVWGLKAMFAVGPSIFFIAAAAVVWNYSIDEKRQREVRAELEQRRADNAASLIAE